MRWQIAAVLATVALSSCAAPDHRYAGSPGSVYDNERDPPVAAGKDSYDPLAPLPTRDYGNGGSPSPMPATPIR